MANNLRLIAMESDVMTQSISRFSMPASAIAAFAAAMVSVACESGAEIVNRGLQSRQWARRFDWNVAAAAQESFYLEVAESRRARSLHA